MKNIGSPLSDIRDIFLPPKQIEIDQTISIPNLPTSKPLDAIKDIIITSKEVTINPTINIDTSSSEINKLLQLLKEKDEKIAILEKANEGYKPSLLKDGKIGAASITKNVGMEIQTNNGIIKENTIIHYQDPNEIERKTLYNLITQEEKAKSRVSIAYDVKKTIETSEKKIESEIWKVLSGSLVSNVNDAYKEDYSYNSNNNQSEIYPPFLAIKIGFMNFLSEIKDYQNKSVLAIQNIKILTIQGKQNLDKQIEQINIWLDSKLVIIEEKLDILKNSSKSAIEDIALLSKEYINSFENFNNKVISHDKISKFEDFFIAFPISNLKIKLSFLQTITEKLHKLFELNIDKIIKTSDSSGINILSLDQRLTENISEIKESLINQYVSKQHIDNYKLKDIILLPKDAPTDHNNPYKNQNKQLILLEGDELIKELMYNKSKSDITVNTSIETKIINKSINSISAQSEPIKYINSLIFEKVKNNIEVKKLTQPYEVHSLYNKIQEVANAISKNMFSKNDPEDSYLDHSFGSKYSGNNCVANYGQFIRDDYLFDDIKNINLSGNITNNEHTD